MEEKKFSIVAGRLENDAQENSDEVEVEETFTVALLDREGRQLDFVLTDNEKEADAVIEFCREAYKFYYNVGVDAKFLAALFSRADTISIKKGSPRG